MKKLTLLLPLMSSGCFATGNDTRAGFNYISEQNFLEFPHYRENIEQDSKPDGG